MSHLNTQRLSDAVTLHTFTDPRFKTLKVSVDMFVPLEKATASRNAILPTLVSRVTREYPDFTSFNRRMAQLYGASINSSVQKIGDYQVLTLSANGISNRYAFGGENMTAQLTSLLFDMLFDPLKDSDGLFPLDGFQQKQRQLLELIDSEYNDKMVYAHRRSEELLFQGQNAGLNCYGTKEDMENLDRQAVTAAWDEVLRTAKFELYVLGDCEPDPDLFRSRFEGVGQSRKTGILAFEKPQEIRRLVEEQPLSQSKLSMGYRADYEPKEKLLFWLMATVLGGVPSSKLFQNVREKMSLCYYCSAGMHLNSRAMYIESGVETENLERAEEAIQEQLQALQRGELTEEELLSAKLALKNSLRSVGDSLYQVENWYLGQYFGGLVLSPEEAADRLMTYTRDQVVEVAGRLYPASVYTLKGDRSHG